MVIGGGRGGEGGVPLVGVMGVAVETAAEACDVKHFTIWLGKLRFESKNQFLILNSQQRRRNIP